MTEDRLESFGIYKMACQLFDDFWTDSEIVGKDYPGEDIKLIGYRQIRDAMRAA